MKRGLVLSLVGGFALAQQPEYDDYEAHAPAPHHDEYQPYPGYEPEYYNPGLYKQPDYKPEPEPKIYPLEYATPYKSPEYPPQTADYKPAPASYAAPNAAYTDYKPDLVSYLPNTLYNDYKPSPVSYNPNAYAADYKPSPASASYKIPDLYAHDPYMKPDYYGYKPETYRPEPYQPEPEPYKPEPEPYKPEPESYDSSDYYKKPEPYKPEPEAYKAEPESYDPEPYKKPQSEDPKHLNYKPSQEKPYSVCPKYPIVAYSTFIGTEYNALSYNGAYKHGFMSGSGYYGRNFWGGKRDVSGGIGGGRGGSGSGHGYSHSDSTDTKGGNGGYGGYGSFGNVYGVRPFDQPPRYPVASYGTILVSCHSAHKDKYFTCQVQQTLGGYSGYEYGAYDQTKGYPIGFYPDQHWLCKWNFKGDEANCVDTSSKTSITITPLEVKNCYLKGADIHSALAQNILHNGGYAGVRTARVYKAPHYIKLQESSPNYYNNRPTSQSYGSAESEPDEAKAA